MLGKEKVGDGRFSHCFVFSNSDHNQTLRSERGMLGWRATGWRQRDPSENASANPKGAGCAAPTSACVFQKSASLELFTSQLMTRTSGRQRMLRVWTCGRSGRW